jgi:predicted DCC family thiol-disulfide oxidoreductase YuxK
VEDSSLPLLIFDGDCGFCTSSAQWAARGWSGTESAVPWQMLGPNGLGRLGLDVGQAQKKAWWIDAHSGLSGGHRAIGKALAAGSGWRRLAGALILTPPLSILAAVGYRIVARYRYRLPGGTPACRIG